MKEAKQAAGKEKYTACEHDIFPDGNGEDCMIGNKCIKQGDDKKHKRSEPESF